MNRHSTINPIAIDLFAGVGGLSLGLESAGFDVLAAVEYDPVHSAVHEFNFPDTTVFCQDIREVTGRSIRQNSTIGNKEVALVAGGPPCQGISTIGKRSIDDPRNELLKEFVRLVLEIGPRYFMMENVSGLAAGKHRFLLEEVIELLQEAGYEVLPYKILEAAHYGTPQSRRRLILIGGRTGLPLPNYPKQLFSSRKINGETTNDCVDLPLCPSVAEAIFDLPDADMFEELLNGDTVAKVEYGQPSSYAALLRGIKKDPSDYSALRECNQLSLTASSRTVHTSESIERFMATLPGTIEAKSRFLRLHPEGISNTLRAGTASDHGAHTAPRPIHPQYPRVITVREAARLHGYPDWFRFHVTKWNGFREIGNSVPIVLGRAVASEIIKAGGWAPLKKPIVKQRSERLLSLTQTQAEKYYGISSRVIQQRVRRVNNGK